MIYLIGSLRNPQVTVVAKQLRDAGLEVFDDWYAAGPEADDMWKEYEIERGRNYREALQGAAARNVFAFDRRNLEAAESVVLVLPAGKSGHLELGWSIGRGKRGYIFLDSPDRWDVMYQFADLVTENLEEIIEHEQLSRRPKLSPDGGGEGSETNQVGPAVLGSGSPRGFVEQGPINPKWCSYCRVGKKCDFCGLQWFPAGDAGQGSFLP